MQESYTSDNSRYILQVYVGALSLHYEALSVEASKQTTAEEIVSCIVERLALLGNNYELAEVAGECKERRLSPDEKPVSVMLLWPMHSDSDFHRFYLRETQSDITWLDSYGLDSTIFRDFIPFLLQPENREYPDLCQLPDLNETSLLENLKQRFDAGYIYTYVGSILIAVNPFKFYPIYNPKYVRLYQNQRIGPILPPHIFAIADNAYYSMLKENKNQCIVISGESGSGKTESTNFLLHHLTALSQKGSHGSGVEQTILSAGPVLEAFGNAKTAHNNNSSRFGKFIQVNYRENGMVQGAVVQKYLLEKSRIVSQGAYERNYHVFYYLLSGTTDSEREILHLLKADQYHYLNSKNLTLENCDEKYEFSRLKQSMEMVGFSPQKQRRLFNVLSAVLLLGNVEFFPKKSTYHHDESVQVRNIDVVSIISELLKVKQDTLLAALTSKRVKASGETLIMQYKLPEAIAARDALAKCLYSSLFDWIVLQVNHALLNKDQAPHTGHSIGVLDIFGFEDFGPQNNFEQLCINYANEHLQYYFNLHVFKYEQNEYKREGIQWRDIEFMDNSECLQLFESKPTGLLCILDDLSNFPGATNETLLQKFNSVHKNSKFYEKPQRKESAFIVRHYAGQVKYQVTEMREKNLDLMRQDIVSVLKNSSMAFVRELVGADPVAVFRWAILRAFFRSYFAFKSAGQKHRKDRYDYAMNKVPGKHRIRPHNDLILSKLNTIRYQQTDNINRTPRRWSSNVPFNSKNFPDGKLAYENNQDNIGNKAFTNNYPKFERSCQDVIARASQIVQKNKSFRPRERPKKGLKNLQTVKMMTAGTNLINQTGVKTRKQPLTVTAQFQNSLTLLMDTLNQANPFFIRCIKSNAQKIPNKFDDATVVRQLRYTGMLETVRIRRAGYNVRLTYEEFIQLYRILLPKGLISSQKDVKDFLCTMDLNKQHYQLGITKIYMRESQKMKLDIKLHTKIIDSIILIQRWYRGILQRKKFLLCKSSAITIQSFWRMCLAQKDYCTRKLYDTSAIIIQATWKMYKTKTWYKKLKKSVVTFQSCARGFITRKKCNLLKMVRKFVKSQNLKKIKTESSRFEEIKHLPDDKKILNLPDSKDDLNQLYKNINYSQNSSNESFGQSLSHKTNLSENIDSQNIDRFIQVQDEEVLQKAGSQLRSLMISSGSSNKSLDNVQDNNLIEVYNTDVSNPRFKQNRIEYPNRDISKKIFFDDSKDILPRLEEKLQHKMSDTNPPLRCESYDECISSEYFKNMSQKSYYNKLSRRAQDLSQTSCKSALDLNDRYTGIEKPIIPNFQEQYKNLDILLDNKNISLPTSYKNLPHQVSSYSKDSQLNDNEILATATPKGKAAALLGSISKEQNLCNISAGKYYGPQIKNRRIKANLSDDLPGAVYGSQHSNKPQLLQHEYLTDTLKRRNSDPSTNKISLLEVNRGNDMYQSSTNINIAGHRFRKVARIGKAERCGSCQESDAFVNEGYRCIDCKVLVHTKCIQNGGVKSLICDPKRSKRLRKSIDKSFTSNSKYSGTREYTDSADRIISDAKELNLMHDFITQKIYKMDETEGEKSSEVDKVFKQALRAFKDNLVTQYSVAHKQNSDQLNIKYRDLIDNFGQVMETCCGKNNDFPLTMGVNAFRGFMNEFMNSRETEKPKTKRKKDKKRKVEEHTTYNGHTFQLTIINIPTACEICQLFLLWPIERGLVCQNCRLTCHKRCYQKTSKCNKIVKQACGDASALRENIESNLFGIALNDLCNAESAKIPVKIEQLITKIEMLGLYSEGIYRKSGVSSKIKELKLKMSDKADVDYEAYNVNVLANVLKSFLREMPEPLLTFDRYDDFIRAADLQDTDVRVQTLLSLVKKLTPTHHALLERLIFHLALVAQREKHNRMSASSLAIVFAPCILRTNRMVPAQDSLNDIGRQTKCIETLITQKMLNVRSTLADIDTLDTAARTATTRLSSLRSSRELTQQEEIASRPESETEARILLDHIQEIKKEKEILTSGLPNLVRASSDDDLLSTDLEGEGGSLDDLSTSKDKDSQSLNELNKDLRGNDSLLYENIDEGNSSSKTYKNISNYSASKDKTAGLNKSMDSSSASSAYYKQEHNIDYIVKPRHYLSLDQGTFSSRSPETSKSSLRTGSQHNLNYLTNTNVVQKPLAMRSMSGGYEPLVGNINPQGDNYNPSPINPRSGKGNNNLKDKNNRSNKKKQDSVDDEPIMV